jgi:cytochrome c oxidase subunit 4
MQKTNLTHEQEVHVESHVPTYLKVWGALLVFTLMEYFYAWKFAHVGFLTLVLGLMTMAVIKAGMVGWYFMHLKFEGRWPYYMLLPAAFLVMVFIFALYPDIGMQRTAVPSGEEEEEAMSAPLNPGTAVALRG